MGANYYKKIGHLELIGHFRESDTLTIKNHYNEAVTAEINIRGIEELRDLQYAIERALEYATAKA